LLERIRNADRMTYDRLIRNKRKEEFKIDESSLLDADVYKKKQPDIFLISMTTIYNAYINTLNNQHIINRVLPSHELWEVKHKNYQTDLALVKRQAVHSWVYQRFQEKLLGVHGFLEADVAKFPNAFWISNERVSRTGILGSPPLIPRQEKVAQLLYPYDSSWQKECFYTSLRTVVEECNNMRQYLDKNTPREWKSMDDNDTKIQKLQQYIEENCKNVFPMENVDHMDPSTWWDFAYRLIFQIFQNQELMPYCNSKFHIQEKYWNVNKINFGFITRADMKNELIRLQQSVQVQHRLEQTRGDALQIMERRRRRLEAKR